MISGEPLHLAIAFDKNYLLPFYALLTSILKNNKKNHIVIHAIVTEVPEVEKEAIRNYAKESKCDIIYYQIEEAHAAKFVITGTWSKAVYYRLYFPFLVPDSVKRLLYLDTDILVLKDLSELYHLDIGGFPLGAVYDNWVKTAPHIGIEGEESYFNSGVLLIDTVRWKEQEISEKAFHYLATYPERIKFVDQDALNAVLINNWKKLDAKFNLMYSLIPEGLSRKDLKNFIAEKVVLHFTLQRPWQLLCRNRFRKLYFYYLKLSPAKERQKIVDYDWRKLPALSKLRLTEYYYDIPLLQRLWRKIKGTSKYE